MRPEPESALRHCPVFMLAGGLGTRLRSAYKDGPKVMAPINGVPFLGYLLKSLALAGFREVVLCVGYRSDRIEQWLTDGAAFGLSIHYSHESEPLGTAGAFRLAFSKFGAGRRFFAMNGDSILQLDFQALYCAHVAKNNVATMALVSVADTSRYGTVAVDDSGLVNSFREKGVGGSSGCINGGVYLFEPSVMDLVPIGRAVSLEREVLPAIMERGLHAFCTTGYFIDIGIPEDYERAQLELKGLGVWP